LGVYCGSSGGAATPGGKTAMGGFVFFRRVGVGDCRRDDLVQVLHHAVLEFGPDFRPGGKQRAFFGVGENVPAGLMFPKGLRQIVGTPDE